MNSIFRSYIYLFSTNCIWRLFRNIIIFNIFIWFWSKWRFTIYLSIISIFIFRLL
jgi:hypothetical protein